METFTDIREVRVMMNGTLEFEVWTDVPLDGVCKGGIYASTKKISIEKLLQLSEHK